MSTCLEMQGMLTGERIRGWPGYEDWVFEVDVGADGRAQKLRAERPRKSRKLLTADEESRILSAVEAQHGAGVFDPDDSGAARLQRALVDNRSPAATGFGAVDFVVASRPYPRGRHNRRERAETIAMVYGISLSQGLCPFKVLSTVYGFPVDTSGIVDEFSSTLHRWVREARAEKFLAPYDNEEHRPHRWPGSRGHHLEGRRSPTMRATTTRCECDSHG